MISNSLKRAYFDFSKVTRAVMRGDLENQYAIRSEVRSQIRMQISQMSEAELVGEVQMIGKAFSEALFQARFNEATGSHSIDIRSDVIRHDGSVTQFDFLTKEEVLEKLNGTSNDFSAAVGTLKGNR
jgi:hypothetical protein